MGEIFRNINKENFDFKNEEYNPIYNKNEENDNQIYLDIPAEFPGSHLERNNQVDVIMDLQNDDNSNIEAAESERNCELGEILVANGREPGE